MAYNDTTFRALFPEFKDTTKYPTELIQLIYGVAQIYIVPGGSFCRMLNGASLDYALMCMTAHLLYLHMQRVGAGDDAGGESVGFVQSASIGDVSVTKAAIPAADQWEYWLNGTPYGQALLALLQGVSVGGLYVGGNAVPERTAFRKAGGVFF